MITQQPQLKMDSNSHYKALFNKAVQLLAQRNHSSAELKQKLSMFYLKALSHQDEALDSISPQIDRVIEYCLSHHWLNDEEYVEQYINMRIRKGYGKNRIVMELKQRGLKDAVILDVMRQKQIDWHELAILQIKKRFPLINQQDSQQKAKIFQCLLYRGFSHEDAYIAYSSLE